MQSITLPPRRENNIYIPKPTHRDRPLPQASSQLSKLHTQLRFRACLDTKSVGCRPFLGPTVFAKPRYELAVLQVPVCIGIDLCEEDPLCGGGCIHRKAGRDL